MSRARQRLGQTASAFGAAFRNPNLRRLELAYGAAVASEWAYVIALSLFAYAAGGPLAVGVVGLVRMLPAAVATPFAALAGDRYGRETVLLGVTLASACALAASAAGFWLGAGVKPLYVLAAFHAVVSTLFRPTLNALLPSVARTPEELIAANSASLTLESAGTLAGPIAGGALFAVFDAGAVFALGTALYVIALLLVAGIRLEGALLPSGLASATRITSELFAGLRLVATEPHPRLLIGLFGAQTVVRGALNVLIVVTVFRLLDEGEEWVGLLTAALGVGGLFGAFFSVGLAGRGLAAPFGLGLVLWGIPIALIAAWPNEAWAFLLIAAVGAGNSLGDVAGFTLLQRVVPDELLARVFGVLFGLAMAGVAVGSIVAPALISGFGTQGALVATGCLLPLLVLVAWPRLAAIDRSAAAPARELELLQQVAMFAPLSVAAKEHLAAHLTPLRVPAGTEIMREGEFGDRFYILVAGKAVVTQGGRHIRTARPGDFFGEIALLRDVPRTATVTARTEAELNALEREEFLAAVTGHTAGLAAGEAIVRKRLASQV